MQGSVHRYHPESPVVAFVDRTAANVVVFLHGVTGGILDCPYLPSLSSSLSLSSSSSSPSLSSSPNTKEEWGLIQPLLRSCYNQFGFCSIFSDVEDVDHLLSFFDELYSQNEKLTKTNGGNEMKLKFFKKVVLMGFSTGCQVALLYLRHGKFRQNINGVVLHGPVSDRFALTVDASEKLLQEHLELAKKMKQEGRKDDFLPHGALYGTPVTASRYISIAERLGAEDFFSPDLTEKEIFLKFPRRDLEKGENGEKETRERISALILLMGKDEYVPCSVDQMSIFQRISGVVCVSRRRKEVKGEEEEGKDGEEEGEEEGRLFERFEVVEVEGAKHYCEEQKNIVALVANIVAFLDFLHWNKFVFC